ncbi:MAG: glycine--tRNA ligase subunit beta [Wenzhouxiangellaceae bacterium]|nr:glycine--tRNA ligase subunit beta [Wenzhouxiangellaceae bacterium]
MSTPLLIELGTEELPARALVSQAKLLADGLKKRLLDAGLLDSDRVRWLATPRRLAVIAEGVRERQPDRKLPRKGPAEAAAFDADGNPTRAAEGFARSVGMSVAELGRLDNEQGCWLYAEIEQPGQALGEMLAEMLDAVVREMAGARSMRWSDRSDRFLRPVRWLVALHGETIVPCTLFGLEAGRETRGHRIHAPEPIALASAADYEGALKRGFVLADFDRRRARIAQQVQARAADTGLQAHDDPALLDEVTGLVEWPVAVVGGFDPAFLEVPPEALISAMREHQKTFPLFDDHDRLAPKFISIANLESRDPAAMIRGFERVIRPRLADARFFFEQDRLQRLDSRRSRLSEMLFQERLGSLADKSTRLEQLAARLAPAFDADATTVARAAQLCKCDLLTEMVGEFPELQGTMGRYYALADGEAPEVAGAIESHYQPRHAGDALPEDAAGRTLAVADRLDSLVGVFAAGKKPKGGKDPFALRRAALGVVRILEAAGVTATVRELLEHAAAALAGQVEVAEATLDELVQFIDDRLRAHLGERGLATNTLHATAAGPCGSVADFIARAESVQRFADDPEMASLIAANKRAANLLDQNDSSKIAEVDRNLLREPAESALFTELEAAESVLREALARADYPAALHRLAQMKGALDRFFDDVMVMVEAPDLRANRLALLARLRALVLSVADVARLGRA